MLVFCLKLKMGCLQIISMFKKMKKEISLTRNNRSECFGNKQVLWEDIPAKLTANISNWVVGLLFCCFHGGVVHYTALIVLF